MNIWMESLWRDFCYAARMLSKSPGFTIVAVLTLTLVPCAITGVLLNGRPGNWFLPADQIKCFGQHSYRVILSKGKSC